MKIIKGRYLIEYDNGIKQEKNLISHTDFKNIISPLRLSAEYFSSIKNYDMEHKIKKELKSLIGNDDFFTDESGLFKASKTGILELSENMGGHRKCIVTKIN